MAMIQVILAGRIGTSVHDTYDFPLVLQYGSGTRYSQAEWVIPTFGPHIPAGRLSEIRVQNGEVDVLIDGPDGFRSGPYTVSWVRSQYPRGKDCSLLLIDHETHKMIGVSLSTVEESLIVDEFSTGAA